MNPLELTIFGLIGSQLVLAFQVVRLQIRVKELDAQAHTHYYDGLPFITTFTGRDYESLD